MTEPVPTRHLLPKPCAVYRHFNAAGELLYVGQSVTPLKRNTHHRRADWHGEIATITLESFPTEQEALHAEMKAVDEEHPRHNKPRGGKQGNGISIAKMDPRWRSDEQREADARREAGLPPLPTVNYYRRAMGYREA